MRMLDRWAMDEKMFTEDPLGKENQNGLFITYHSNGNKSIKGECDNGNPIGKWIYYDKDGFITKIDEY